MLSMLRQPDDDTQTAGLRVLGALSGARPRHSPLMRRLVEMARTVRMDQQPSARNDWGLSSVVDAFRGVPIEGGSGFRDYLGGFLGSSVPGVGGGAPGGRGAPGLEGDMYSTGVGGFGAGLGAGGFSAAGGIGGGLAGGMGADLAAFGYL
jgi:hypothetical protein